MRNGRSAHQTAVFSCDMHSLRRFARLHHGGEGRPSDLLGQVRDGFGPGADRVLSPPCVFVRRAVRRSSDITLSGFPIGSSAGGVRLDGSYIAVGDSQSTIYRTQGSNVVSTTSLSATCVFGFYIVPSKAIIAPDQCSKNLVGSYAYPAGGSPIKTFTKGLATPYDAVLSR